MPEDKRRYSIQFSISTVFIAILTLIMLLIISVTYWRFNHTLFSLSRTLVERSAHAAQNKFSNHLVPLMNEAQLTLFLFENDVVDNNNKLQLINYQKSLLKTNPQLISVYWATAEGDLLAVNQRENDKFFILDIVNNPMAMNKKITIENRQGRVLENKTITQTNYDPRQRSWYKKAALLKKIIWSNVYQFSGELSNKKDTLGLTAAIPVFSDSDKLIGVFGLDIDLEYITHYLSELKISPNSTAVIINEQGNLMAAPGISHPLLINKDKTQLIQQPPWLPLAYNTYEKNKSDFFTFKFNGETFLASFKTVGEFIDETWYIVVVTPKKDFMGEIYRVNMIVFLLYLFFLALGITLVNVFSNRIRSSLKQLIHYSQRVKSLQLSQLIDASSRFKEIRYLQQSLNEMGENLRLFKRFMPAALTKKLIAENPDIRISGRRETITILFSRLHDFDKISNNMRPNQAMETLSTYFDMNTQIIQNNNGTVDQYIAENIMALWGAPTYDEQQIVHACQAALLIKTQLNDKESPWLEIKDKAALTHMSLHSGLALVGNVGSTERLNYTALGMSTKISRYLNSLNAHYDTQIIVSETIYEPTKTAFAYRLLDEIRLLDSSKPLKIYELVATAQYLENPKFINYCQQFNTAFIVYQKGDWQEALQRFQQLHKNFPDDTLSSLYVKRCQSTIQKKPQNWTGIWLNVPKDIESS